MRKQVDNSSRTVHEGYTSHSRDQNRRNEEGIMPLYLSSLRTESFNIDEYHHGC